MFSCFFTIQKAIFSYAINNKVIHPFKIGTCIINNAASSIYNKKPAINKTSGSIET